MTLAGARHDIQWNALDIERKAKVSDKFSSRTHQNLMHPLLLR
jgi:hypothetical protein